MALRKQQIVYAIMDFYAELTILDECRRLLNKQM